MAFTAEISVQKLPRALRDVYHRWHALALRGSLPSLEHLNEAGLLEDTVNIILTEVLRDTDGTAVDFEVVYLGATIREIAQDGLAGKRLTTVPGKGPGSQIWAAYATIARDARPLQVSLPWVGPTPQRHHTNEMFLPLCRDGTGIRADFVLAVVLLEQGGDSPNQTPIDGAQRH